MRILPFHWRYKLLGKKLLIYDIMDFFHFLDTLELEPKLSVVLSPHLQTHQRLSFTPFKGGFLFKATDQMKVYVEDL